MSHIWRSHVTHMKRMNYVACMNQSCRTYEGVMSHIWMSHVAHICESCHTYKWVMSHTWISHVAHTNTSCPTDECVTSQVWMSHVPCTNKSYPRYEWVMSHIGMIHVTLKISPKTPHTRRNPRCAFYNRSKSTWRIDMWEMTCFFLGRDSCIRGIPRWLFHYFYFTTEQSRLGAFIFGTWPIHIL